MKTAVSLPDLVFFEAEETAKNMGISRSALYHKALIDFLKKNNRKYITQKLNAIYTDEYYKEFEPITNAAVKEITKNEAW